MQESKKNNNNLIIGVIVAVLVGAGVFYFVTNKSDNGDKGSNSGESSQEETTKGKCKIFDCMKKLNGKMTVEEVNEVIGFEGEKGSDEDSYVIYKWELSDDTSISGQFFKKYNTVTITANYPNSMVKGKADFSRWDEIKKRLSSTKNKLTYSEFVEMVGGVEGTIDKISDNSTTYKWLNADGGYLSGYFNDDNECTMATGRF